MLSSHSDRQVLGFADSAVYQSNISTRFLPMIVDREDAKVVDMFLEALCQIFDMLDILF